MTSVFGQLFKYRPRENRLPQEDFFTEALAGVLQKTPEVCTKFVEWLIRHDSCDVEIKEAGIDTQKSVDGGRLDIYVDARSADEKRHVVGVENKISAKEGERQLERYLEYLGSENDAATRTLVYITRVSEPNPFKSKPDNVVFKHLKWFQVYDWLKEAKEAAESGHVFLYELLELMKEWNMTSKSILSATDLAAAIRYKKLAEPQFWNVLEMVKEKQNHGINKRTGRWGSGSLSHYTPYLGDSGFYLYFGFDFDREDNDWSVEKLCIPSAFVGVCGNDEKPAFLKRLSDDWIDVPQYMEWKDGLYVKQMHKKLLVSKDSFGEAYLDFFNTAIQDFKKVAPRGWFVKSS